MSSGLPVPIPPQPNGFMATEAHQYFYMLTPIPGVTTLIAESGLSNDFSGVPSGVLERAAERGSDVHDATYFLLEDDLDEESLLPDVAEHMRGVDQVLKSASVEAWAHELHVCSPSLRVGGRLDIWGLVYGGPGLVDVKSGETRVGYVSLQLWLYRRALVEMYEIASRGGEVEVMQHAAELARLARLWCLRTKPARLVEVGLPDDEETCLAMLALHRRRESRAHWRKV